MDKTFDDLFNEFLKRNKEIIGDDTTSTFKNEAKKLIDMIKNFEELIEIARQQPKMTLSVAAAEDNEVLLAIDAARKLGIVDAILVGDKDQMKVIAKKPQNNFLILSQI